VEDAPVITDPQPTTRRLAITMVTAAVRGDAGTVKALLRAVDDDELATVVHTTLALARAVAGQLLTAAGMMGADLWLAEASRGHPCAETRLGAALVLAHAQTVGEFDELVVIGVGAYNAVCIEADEGFDEVFTAGMLCWRSLLTIAATSAGPIMVANTAHRLWDAPEPAKPRPIEGTETLFGTRTKAEAEGSPPGPALSVPAECEVAGGPPPWPTAPAGAPISLRGVAIRRLQDSGVW
jgi:hypothetical protein